MIELTLEFGEVQTDKIRLGTRRIKKLLRTHKELKKDLLKILDKGGLVVVASGATLITAYNWN
jgi:23S rRNA G2069 N7-methylase RlmK/C1962 C5-methylase RlmI